MSMNRGSSVQNGRFPDPVTLAFDLLTPKSYHFEYIPKSFPYSKFEHFGIIFLSYAADKQTNRRQRTAYPRRPRESAWVGNNKTTLLYRCERTEPRSLPGRSLLFQCSKTDQWWELPRSALRCDHSVYVRPQQISRADKLRRLVVIITIITIIIISLCVEWDVKS